MSQPAQEMNHGGRFHIDDRGCLLYTSDAADE